MTAAFSRPAALDRLASEAFDVLVVGGGITGAGVAADAAARGLRTALVERDDWASGASSRSSKLVHGGLRYLQQKEFGLVRESLTERQRLLDNAPHLVRPLPLVMPLLGNGGVVDRAAARGYSTALWLYDLLGGLRIGHRHRALTPAQVSEAFPAVRPGLVASGFEYFDGWADDARLTLAVARTAVDHGAVAANHTVVAALQRDRAGRVRGATLGDGTSVRAAVVVNAGGVWADEIDSLRRDDAAATLRPAKGVHVTVERRRVPCRSAITLPVPGDKRFIFLIPWGDRVYLGTTDTEYEGPLDDPVCTAADVDYLLQAASATLSEALTPADVVGTWAGLRPLLAGGGSERTADLSRRHQVRVSTDGLVTVTGGKLTTYRKMAADTVDEVASLLGHGGRRQGGTAAMPLRGASGPGVAVDPDLLDVATMDHLSSRYGSDAGAVAALVASDGALGRPLVAGLPYLRAEAVYAVRQEMALTLDDVLSRRTRARILARDASAAAAPEVARLVAGELGWSSDRVDSEVAAYVAATEKEREAAGLPATFSPAHGQRP